MAKLEIPVIVKCTEIDELIDEIKHLQTYKLFEGDEQVLIDRDKTIEIFAKHIRASAQPEQPEQRWIPVSRVLPKEDTNVMITYRYKVGEGDISHCDIDITSYGQAYFGGRACGFKEWRAPFEYFHSNYEVVAWMPLPEPYNEE